MLLEALTFKCTKLCTLHGPFWKVVFEFCRAKHKVNPEETKKHDEEKNSSTNKRKEKLYTAKNKIYFTGYFPWLPATWQRSNNHTSLRLFWESFMVFVSIISCRCCNFHSAVKKVSKRQRWASKERNKNGGKLLFDYTTLFGCWKNAHVYESESVCLTVCVCNMDICKEAPFSRPASVGMCYVSF